MVNSEMGRSAIGKINLDETDAIAVFLESFPHFRVFAKNDEKIYFDKCLLIKPISFVAILKLTESLPYNHWIKVFTSKIFEDCGWEQFQYLSELNVVFYFLIAQSLFHLFFRNFFQNQF